VALNSETAVQSPARCISNCRSSCRDHESWQDRA